MANKAKMELGKIINDLFSIQYRELDDEKEEERLENLAQKVVDKYGWNMVFEEANNLLHTKCKTPESVVNFSNLYYLYNWHEYAVPDPYSFLAYIYYIIDFDRIKYNADILDTIVSGMLPASGYEYGSLFTNNWYTPEKDPRLIEAVNQLRNEKTE